MTMGNASPRNLILHHLFFSRQLSCQELSVRLNKSIPFVTKVLTQLLEENWIYEKGLADSTGGRRPLTYAIRPGSLYIIGVSVDQRYTRIAVIDAEHHIVGEPSKADIILKGNDRALDQLTDLITQFIINTGIAPAKFVGIGVGMPGFIDASKGINYTFFSARPIVAHLENATGLRTFIDNDSSVIALAELRFGSAKHFRNAMVVNMSWGVGLGIISEGNLYRGQNGFAGEFSHIPLFNNNKLCSCGKRGCLETEASLQVIVDKARANASNEASTSLHNLSWSSDYETDCEAIIQAALRGDQFAIELFSSVGFHIGRGVAVLIHLFNPAIIILSGRGASAGKIWKAPVQQAVDQYCIPQLSDETIVRVSELGKEAEIIGAAALVMEHLTLASSKNSILFEKPLAGNPLIAKNQSV